MEPETTNNVRQTVGKASFTRFTFATVKQPLVFILLDGTPNSGQDELFNKLGSLPHLFKQDCEEIDLPEIQCAQDSVRYGELHNSFLSLIPLNHNIALERGTCIIMNQSPFSKIVWTLEKTMDCTPMTTLISVLKAEAQNVFKELQILAKMSLCSPEWVLHFVHCCAQKNAPAWQKQTDTLFTMWLDQLRRVMNCDDNTSNKPTIKAHFTVCEDYSKVGLMDFLREHVKPSLLKSISKYGIFGTLQVLRTDFNRPWTRYWSDYDDVFTDSASSSDSDEDWNYHAAVLSVKSIHSNSATTQNPENKPETKATDSPVNSTPRFVTSSPITGPANFDCDESIIAQSPRILCASDHVE